MTGEVTYRHLGSRIALILRLAEAGSFGHALRLCHGPVHRARAGALGGRIGQLMELTRQQVLGMQAEAEAPGTDLSFVSPAPSPDKTGPESDDEPAWPAVVDGHLGWWSEPEYARIVRQVPELGDVLGYPWRRHTSRTESALRASTRRDESGLRLAALYYAEFVDYLISTHADPSAATVQTDFAAKTPAEQGWPPNARHKCWCGSGSRYRDCCGRPN